MNIGIAIYEEMRKLAIPAMPIDQQSTTFIPMVRLTDLEEWLKTLELGTSPSQDSSRVIFLDVPL